MADEAADKPVSPLGAQIMRKLRGGLRALSDECTKMAGPLDACEAKTSIGEVINGLGSHAGVIEKAWAKLYKDFDIDEQDAAPEEMKADAPDDEGETKPADKDSLDDADIDAALAALDDDDADPEEKPEPTEKANTTDDPADDEDDLSPEQERQIKSRIARLERELAGE